MKIVLKGLLREIWKRPVAPSPAGPVASANSVYDEGDPEALEERVPYKLEPSLKEVEEYLGRIRRGGW